VTRPRLIGLASLVAVLLVAGAVVGLLRRGSEPKLPPLPACARPAQTITRPKELPRRFPLPAGTVFTGVNRRFPDFPVVAGRMPVELLEAARYLVRELPRAGFSLGAGEQEAGFEVESDYQGRTVFGRYKVRILFNCRGATRFWISATHPPSAS
jgi:hypothetical protein